MQGIVIVGIVFLVPLAWILGNFWLQSKQFQHQRDSLAEPPAAGQAATTDEQGWRTEEIQEVKDLLHQIAEDNQSLRATNEQLRERVKHLEAIVSHEFASAEQVRAQEQTAQQSALQAPSEEQRLANLTQRIAEDRQQQNQ
jgi:regulator of replication initiation timing